MKSNPLVTFLLGLLTLSVLVSLFFCWRFTTTTGEKGRIQSRVNLMVHNRSVVGGLVNETMEYSKTHPAIEPTLVALQLIPAKSATTATNKPAAK